MNANAIMRKVNAQLSDTTTDKRDGSTTIEPLTTWKLKEAPKIPFVMINTKTVGKILLDTKRVSKSAWREIKDRQCEHEFMVAKPKAIDTYLDLTGLDCCWYHD